MNSSLKNTSAKWGLVSRSFHWVVAFAIIGMLCVGIYMKGMADSAEKWQLYGLHKETGMVVLALVVFRLLWRLSNTVPKLPVEDFLTKLSVPVLYLVMLGMPLSGIVMSEAGGFPISVFGWFDFPVFMDKNPDIGKLANSVHKYLGFTFIGLISLHTLAAFYHEFVLKNGLLRRMITSKD